MREILQWRLLWVLWAIPRIGYSWQEYSSFLVNILSISFFLFWAQHWNLISYNKQGWLRSTMAWRPRDQSSNPAQGKVVWTHFLNLYKTRPVVLTIVLFFHFACFPTVDHVYMFLSFLSLTSKTFKLMSTLFECNNDKQALYLQATMAGLEWMNEWMNLLRTR